MRKGIINGLQSHFFVTGTQVSVDQLWFSCISRLVKLFLLRIDSFHQIVFHGVCGCPGPTRPRN